MCLDDSWNGLLNWEYPIEMFDLFTNFILLKLETDEKWMACNNMICDFDPCVNDDDDFTMCEQK